MKMHPEILSQNQTSLLPLVAKLSSDQYCLAGGTAIALQLGHRSSVDFDLMTHGEIHAQKIISKLLASNTIEKTLVDSSDELTVLVDGVKITFFTYPFYIDCKQVFKEIRMPDLLTLGAMKAYALGRRSKWKDYVDLYFLLKEYSLGEVVKTANEVFNGVFNEKLFREQLVYFDDIDYTESVTFLSDYMIETDTIQKELTSIALS